jgi:hypothetical protein
MSGIGSRIVRAAKLDTGLYEEVEADTGALGQAMLVVVLSSIAGGIGSMGAGYTGLLGGVLWALIGWFLWAFLTYVIGTKLLATAKTEADLGQLLRTIGFSSSPGLIRVVGIVPPLAPIVAIIGGVWMLIAMVVAVRQALDYESIGRAVGVCVIAWLIQAVVLAVIIGLTGGFDGAPSPG